MPKEKTLEELVKTEPHRKIIEYCAEENRSWTDIDKEMANRKFKRSEVQNAMVDLKKEKALDFRNGKYFTTEEAKNYL